MGEIFLNLLRLKCLEQFGGIAVPVFWVLDEARRYARGIQLDQMNNTAQWRPSITHQELPLLGDREIMYPPVGMYGGVAQLRAGSASPFLFSFK